MTHYNNMSLEEMLQEVLSAADDNPLRRMLEFMVQKVLEYEMSEHIGAAPYERTEGRKGQRNGYKPRMLITRVGTLNLHVPQDRDGTFSTALFAKYQRSEKALVTTLMEMYVHGVSTRKVAKITEELCGRSFSSQLVSKLVGDLDGELAAWRSRRLDGEYPYLLVDARYEKVREQGRIVSKGVLIVTGVSAEGFREILAVDVADTENVTTWSELFTDLKKRGVTGVLLVTSDAHEGIKAATSRYFQGASWQRCQFHFSQNCLGITPKKLKGKLASELRAIYDAADYTMAKRLAKETTSRWESLCPSVAEKLDEEIEDVLACFFFPDSHRRRIRTTNSLERLNEEIKRRTRVVRIFPNEAACLRLVSALCVEQSEEWVSGKRYLNMEHLKEWKAAESELVAVAP